MKLFQVPVSCQYGASMGRRNTITEPAYPVKFHLQRVPMVDYDYDQGGAYWGGYSLQCGVMYCAWGDGEEERQIVYCRAHTRDQAKAEVLRQFPNAKFYR